MKAASAGLLIASNPLFCNSAKLHQFEVKPLRQMEKAETLNQRVQGSSPCAPTILLRASQDLRWRSARDLRRLCLSSHNIRVRPSRRKQRLRVTSGEDVARGIQRLHRPSIIVMFAGRRTRTRIGDCAAVH
jgi:hypothetical protein